MSGRRSSLESKVSQNKNKGVRNGKAGGILLVVIGCILIIAAIAMIFDSGVLDPALDKLKSKFGNGKTIQTDWKAYGKALASIETDHPDHDRTIVEVDGTKITKKEYYKLKIADEYTFSALMESYERYCTQGDGKDATEEELEKLKPTRVTDEEILTSLAKVEMIYKEAMAQGIHMDDSIAYQQMQSTYSTYLAIIDLYHGQDELDIYRNAKESSEEIALVAEGMGVSIDEYLEYLAEDNMKSLAGALLEEKWQEEFRNSDYDGDVDGFIEEKYNAVYAKYQPVYYDLE